MIKFGSNNNTIRSNRENVAVPDKRNEKVNVGRMQQTFARNLYNEIQRTLRKFELWLQRRRGLNYLSALGAPFQR